MIDTTKVKERAVLIGLITGTQSKEKVDEYLDELDFLLETAGGITVKRFTQKLHNPESRTFVGTGKLNEIVEFIKDNDINLAVFDDELSPSQIKNLENALKCKILDRTNLILDIFAYRAKTSSAKIQVELAQYQ